MEHLKLLSSVILSACLLSACSGNPSTSANNSSNLNTASTNPGESAYAGNSSFTYTINGKHIAIKYPAGQLFLNKVKNDPAGKLKIEVTNESTSEVFKFCVANAGSTAILHYTPSFSDFDNSKSINAATYMSPKYKNYNADSALVKITDINTTHVAGTFTGKFLSDDDKPVPLEITDGSFDVTFTKGKDK
jgi:hypothetical protein